VWQPKGLAGALVEVGALQAMAQCSLCPTLLDTAIVHNGTKMCCNPFETLLLCSVFSSLFK
jgi:hypothetical protein